MERGAIQPHLTPIRTVQCADDVEQCGLATAGGTPDGCQLSRGKREGYVAQHRTRMPLASVRLRDAAYFQHMANLTVVLVSRKGMRIPVQLPGQWNAPIRRHFSQPTIVLV